MCFEPDRHDVTCQMVESAENLEEMRGHSVREWVTMLPNNIIHNITCYLSDGGECGEPGGDEGPFCAGVGHDAT